MASNDVNLGKGKVSGMAYHATVDADLVYPTYPSESLDTDWKEIGFVSEDGITWTPLGETESLKAWSLETIRQYQTAKGTIVVPIISTTSESLKTVFGNAVSTTSATSAHGELVTVDTSAGPQTVREGFCFIGKDGQDEFMLCGEGIVTEVAEVAFSGEAITWEVTIEGDWKFVKDNGEKTT